MKTSVSTVSKRQAGGFRSYVRQEFRKKYQVPILTYQSGGILSRPLWNTKDHVIRIIPGYDTATGEFFRQNVNCNEFASDADPTDYLSDTFATATTVQYFGESGQTFIVDYAPGSPDAEAYGRDSVITTFIRNVRYSVDAKKKPKFGVTNDMRRWAGKDGCLRFPKYSLLMQALVFKVNGKDNVDENGNPLLDEDGSTLPLLAVVSVDGKQTIANIMNALVEPLDPGKPLDALTNNKYGGMAELDGCKLFLNTVYDAQGKCNALRPSVQEAGKGWTPTPFPLDTDVVKALWHPWENLLCYMTAAEQCEYLASEFGADAVNYLIGTDPLYRSFKMPDDIARSGYGQYAQFVDGVTDVAQTINIPSSTASLGKAGGLAAGLGGMKSKLGLGKMQKPVQPPAETTDEFADVMKEAHVQPQAPKNEFHNVPAGSGIDINKLRSEVARVRAAAAGQQVQPEDDQASAADMLLNDPDVSADMDQEV